MAGASPYREVDIQRVLANVPASSTDYSLLDAVSGHYFRVVAATFLAGGTATEVTLESYTDASAETAYSDLLQEDDSDLYLEDDTNLYQELQDLTVTTALLQENGDVLLLEDSTDLLSEAAGGLAILPLLALGANLPVVLPFNPHGWCQTTAGAGLTVTTGTGSAVGVMLTVVELGATA